MHRFLRARVIAPLLHLVLFVLAFIPRAGGLIGAKGEGWAFLLVGFLDFPVTFLWLVIGSFRLGAVYTLAAMLVLGTVWWFFLGWLIERIVSLYRRR
jgi:hypothetical protein